MGWFVFHRSTILAARFVPASTNLAPRGAKHGPIAARKYIRSTNVSDTPFRHGQVLPDHPLDLLAGLRVQAKSRSEKRMLYRDAMSFSTPVQWMTFCWMAFGLYWLASAFNRKVTKKRETYFERLRYTVPLLIAFYLLFRPEAHYGLLGARFVPAGPATEWTGVAITAAGVAIAIWARWHLGSNWSGVVTLKEGHELIRTGPYRTVRHPIYTGMLIGLFGTLITLGEVRGLIALALAWLSFYVKARREESFLAQEFGPAFAEHQRNTGMFLPRLPNLLA
ncbi:MAG: isoprenylcysteine carboxylmethyltransferase family protein [Candidatus Acidiferrum sp.]